MYNLRVLVFSSNCEFLRSRSDDRNIYRTTDPHFGKVDSPAELMGHLGQRKLLWRLIMTHCFGQSRYRMVKHQVCSDVFSPQIAT